MTAEQFWHSGLDAFATYYNYSIEREKQKYRDYETLCWKIGSKVIQALQQQPVIPYGLLDRKDMKRLIHEYPREPEWVTEAKKQKNSERRKARNLHIVPPTKEEISKYNLMMGRMRMEAARKRRERQAQKQSPNNGYVKQ